MSRVALDTSCMIATVCSWHEHHPAAVSEIEWRLTRGDRLVAPAPALVEAYAVLTRLPPPHRLSGDDAWALIEGNFVTAAAVVALDAEGYVNLLRRSVANATTGGRAYDDVIGECARVGGADTLLTFNRRHFEPAPIGVAVGEPRLRPA